MTQSCIFLHAIMIETCALHQQRFITNICLPGVFQNTNVSNEPTKSGFFLS